ncbi:MAG: outer membrane protein [Alphaproteobacteria bacterium]
MMKKISYALLSTTLLASAATASNATPLETCAPVSAFAGWYAGGKVGHSSSAMFQQYSPGGVAAAGQDVSVPGITGGVFAGWGKEIGTSGLYGGVELAYLLSNDTYKKASTVKKGNTLELAFRLGVVKSENVLLYAKAGYINTKFEVTPPTNLALKKLSKAMNGVLVGAGIDTALSKHVILGMDYTYAMYGKQKQQFQPVGGGATVPGTLKPTSHTVTFRAAYRF